MTKPSRPKKDPETLLTPVQTRFCELVARGATQIDAIRFAMTEHHMLTAEDDESTLAGTACRWMKLPAVAVRIQELRDEIKARIERELEVTDPKVLRETALIGFSDITTIMNPNGTDLLPLSEWPETMRRAVSSYSRKPRFDKEGNHVDTEVSIRLWSKVEALDKLMRHLGMFAQDNAQKVPSPLAALPREKRDQLVEALRGLIAVDPANQTDGGVAITHRGPSTAQ